MAYIGMKQIKKVCPSVLRFDLKEFMSDNFLTLSLFLHSRFYQGSFLKLYLDFLKSKWYRKFINDVLFSFGDNAFLNMT